MPTGSPWKPTRKVATSGLAGLIVSALVLVGKRFGVELQPEESAFLVVIVSSIMGWLVKDKPPE